MWLFKCQEAQEGAPLVGRAFLEDLLVSIFVGSLEHGTDVT